MSQAYPMLRIRANLVVFVAVVVMLSGCERGHSKVAPTTDAATAAAEASPLYQQLQVQRDKVLAKLVSVENAAADHYQMLAEAIELGGLNWDEVRRRVTSNEPNDPLSERARLLVDSRLSVSHLADEVHKLNEALAGLAEGNATSADLNGARQLTESISRSSHTPADDPLLRDAVQQQVLAGLRQLIDKRDQSELNVLVETKAALTAEVAAVQQEQVRLKDAVAVRRAELAGIEDQISTANLQLAEVNASNAKADAELVSLRHDQAQLQEENSSLWHLKDELNREIASSRGLVAEQQAKKADLNGELVGLSADIERAKSDLTLTSDQRKREARELAAARLAHKEALDEVSELTKTQEGLVRRIADTQNGLPETLQRDNARLRAELEARNVELASVRAEKMAIVAEYRMSRQDDQTTAALRAEVTKLQRELNTSREQNHITSAELVRAKRQAGAFSPQVSERTYQTFPAPTSARPMRQTNVYVWGW